MLDQRTADLAAPDFLCRFVEMLDDMEPVEQDLRIDDVVADQSGVALPPVLRSC